MVNDSNTETGRDYVADSRKLTVGSSEYLTDNYHQKLITDIKKEMDSMQTLSQPGLAELTRVDKQSFTFTAWHGRRTHNHSNIQTASLFWLGASSLGIATFLWQGQGGMGCAWLRRAEAAGPFRSHQLALVRAKTAHERLCTLRLARPCAYLVSPIYAHAGAGPGSSAKLPGPLSLERTTMDSATTNASTL